MSRGKPPSRFTGQPTELAIRNGIPGVLSGENMSTFNSFRELGNSELFGLLRRNPGPMVDYAECKVLTTTERVEILENWCISKSDYSDNWNAGIFVPSTATPIPTTEKVAKMPEPVTVPPTDNSILGGIELIATVAAQKVCTEMLEKFEAPVENNSDSIKEMVDAALEELRPNVTNVTVNGVVQGSVEGVQHEAFEKILKIAAIGQNVFMPGEPGTGKSQIAENICKALGIEFNFLSCSGIPQDHLIEGFIDANGNCVNTDFVRAYSQGEGFLIDEIDAAYGSTIVAMNAALAGNWLSTPAGKVRKHKNFRLFAAGNTVGDGATEIMSGRQEIDMATRTRFAVVQVNTDEKLEEKICASFGIDSASLCRTVRKMRANRNTHKIPTVVSMRQTINAAELIAGGFSQSEAIELHFRMGMTDAVWAKMTDQKVGGY